MTDNRGGGAGPSLGAFHACYLVGSLVVGELLMSADGEEVLKDLNPTLTDMEA